MTLTVLDHPLAQDLLGRLRDRRTGPAEFRALTRRLGALLIAKATESLSTREARVTTPLEGTATRVLAQGLVAVPVLRAGLGLLDSVTDLFPDAVVGYLGMERDEVTLEPRHYYAKLPAMGDRHALVLDPMLATGGSGSAACSHVRRARPLGMTFVCVVAAPEGIAKMQTEHPDVPIVTAAVDRGLNEQGFIMPGLGDFGDRLHGTATDEA